MAASSDYAYRRDFVGRIPFAIGPLEVRLAAHLEGHPLLTHTEPVLSAFREGRDLAAHVSPMKAVRSAFKKATRNGDWSRYAKMMDLVLNKWGIFHFHVDSSRMLVFAYLCARASTAYVIDIRGHDGNWKVERHLVGIVAENWPGAGIISEIGSGSSKLTEADLLAARTQRVNLSVEVSGRFYLPASRGLMMDGTGYDSMTGIVPLVVTAKRFDPNSVGDETVTSPHLMMVGVDPGDPRPPYEVAAAHLGTLATQRREAMARATIRDREAILLHAARTLQSGHRS